MQGRLRVHRAPGARPDHDRAARALVWTVLAHVAARGVGGEGGLDHEVHGGGRLVGGTAAGAGHTPQQVPARKVDCRGHLAPGVAGGRAPGAGVRQTGAPHLAGGHVAQHVARVPAQRVMRREPVVCGAAAGSGPVGADANDGDGPQATARVCSVHSLPSRTALPTQRVCRSRSAQAATSKLSLAGRWARARFAVDALRGVLARGRARGAPPGRDCSLPRTSGRGTGAGYAAGSRARGAAGRWRAQKPPGPRAAAGTPTPRQRTPQQSLYEDPPRGRPQSRPRPPRPRQTPRRWLARETPASRGGLRPRPAHRTTQCRRTKPTPPPAAPRSCNRPWSECAADRPPLPPPFSSPGSAPGLAQGNRSLVLGERRKNTKSRASGVGEKKREKVYEGRDSNPRPLACKTNALTTAPPSRWYDIAERRVPGNTKVHSSRELVSATLRGPRAAPGHGRTLDGEALDSALRF